MNVYRIDYTPESRYEARSQEPKYVAAKTFVEAAQIAEVKVKGTIQCITVQTTGLIVGDTP